jgi:hypothetical protein
MARYNAPLEIHVHGQVTLRGDVTLDHLQDALKPLWKYAGARSLKDAAGSFYEDEPGIKFEEGEPKPLQPFSGGEPPLSNRCHKPQKCIPA